MMENIHATCVSLNGKGILFLGKSGAGKSDLALRLITMFKAELVADDRVDIETTPQGLKASAPQNLKGLLEVRGVGIISLPVKPEIQISLAVELTEEKIERLPEESFYSLCGKKVPFIKLNPFEASAPAKVLAALSLL